MIRLARDPVPEPPILPDRMRISVEPVYSSAHSQPPNRYVFVYFIRIENIGDETAQLFWRHWKIHDEAVGDQEVSGEGVVGECPTLAPGDAHEYNSFCVLEGPNGFMEGYYHFRRTDGSVFRAEIPRFLLRAPTQGGPTHYA
ncbi:MAG: Co2+/Mg2+ efflux protein ApaG [Gemmatimonadota bacterium]|nr:Co2+/Mg2+ efflux protein ApaG [Gemmatimonadota bacterium]